MKRLINWLAAVLIVIMAVSVGNARGAQDAEPQNPKAGKYLSHEAAEKIMGRNFFGPKEVKKHFGKELQEAEIPAIPFSEETLRKHADDFLLVLNVSDASCVAEIMGIARTLFKEPEEYSKEEACMWEQGKTAWHLVRKEAVPQSRGKSLATSEKLLSSRETIPSIQLLVYSAVGHFLQTGQRIFEDAYVRSSSIGLEKKRIDIDFTCENRACAIEINCIPDQEGHSEVGLASELKPEI